MNDAEIAALKQELKEEIMQEITCQRRTTDWIKVKKAINPMLLELGFPAHDRHKMTNAISTVVRLALGIKNVAHIDGTHVATATSIATTIINVVRENKSTDADGR